MAISSAPPDRVARLLSPGTANAVVAFGALRAMVIAVLATPAAFLEQLSNDADDVWEPFLSDD